jgi:hypothetical protein
MIFFVSVFSYSNLDTTSLFMSKFARISGLKMLSYIHDPEGTVITGFSHILVLKKLNLNFLKAMILQI